MTCDAAEQLLRRLHDEAVLAREVPRAEHRQSILRERRRHVSTVRSAASARNRGGPSRPWLILAIALALLALSLELAWGDPALPVRAATAHATKADDAPVRAFDELEDLADRLDLDNVDELDLDDRDDLADLAAPRQDALDLDELEARRPARDLDDLDDFEARRPARDLDDLDDLDDLETRRDSAVDGEPDDVVGRDASGASDELDDSASHDLERTVDLTNPSLGAAGSEDDREAMLRRSGSKIGRVDVSLIWRRTDPMISPTRDEVWLLGTWRP